ncbi:MAG: hypothetical protein HYS05_06980, partial [Acidobacteria bacterium]|nr:hypothetical protein [Acidobacteriota bacterium]
MTAPRHLKVFLSSPGDVAEERKAAREILERLPRDPLLTGQITIEIVSWDDPYAPTPLLANLTPQQAIDRGLPRPSDCDLTVVIFWGRMGTPLSEPRKADGTQYFSGTEYEFVDARGAGKPTLLYRRTAKVLIDIDDPDFEGKRQQKRLVDQFFEQFKNADGSISAGYNQYGTVAEFRKDFEAHVKARVRELTTTGGDPLGMSNRLSLRRAQDKPTVSKAYRDWLKAKCASVELLGLRLKQGQAVRLHNVYVPLTTPGSATLEETGKRGRPRADEAEAVTLLLHRLGEGSLYVSGDPGSGKSTFCRWLVWLACEGTVPPAEVDAPDEYRERLPPMLGNRLPLLVYLREFWRRLPDRAQHAALSGQELETLLADWLAEKNIPDLSAEIIAAHFEAGTTLLALDGLDEVPPVRRTMLLG